MFERNFIILRKNVTSSLCKCNMLISLFTRSHFYWNLAVFNKQLVWICQRKFRRALSWGNFTLHGALTSLYRHENMSSAFSPTSSFSIFSLSFLVITLEFWNDLLWADDWRSWPQMRGDIVTEKACTTFQFIFFFNLILQLSFLSHYLDYSTFSLVEKAHINIIIRFWQHCCVFFLVHWNEESCSILNFCSVWTEALNFYILVSKNNILSSILKTGICLS